MKNLERGLHETLVTQALAERIARLDESLHPQHRPIRKEEAGDRLALHLSRCLMQAIDSIPESNRLSKGVDLAQRVIDELDKLGNSKERSDEEFYISPLPSPSEKALLVLLPASG